MAKKDYKEQKLNNAGEVQQVYNMLGMPDNERKPQAKKPPVKRPAAKKPGK